MTVPLQFDVNGRFLTQAITGVQRHARELLTALDRLLTDGLPHDVRVLVPRNGVQAVPTLRHLRITPVGRWRGHLWEQLDLARAARGRLLLSLCNTGPLGHATQIVTIHDASVFAIPEAYAWRFRSWYRWLLPRLGHRALQVLTDSWFSRDELMHHLALPAERLRVVSLGAEHLARERPVRPSALPPDDDRPLVLLVASRSRHKNFRVALQAAMRLPKPLAHVVVVGGANARIFGDLDADLAGASDMTWLGYVTDAELQWLYRHATVLLYPSRYEGFGLPPLEAMHAGCAVVVSRVASLPEVCGDAALYADPDDADALAEAVVQLLTHAELREAQVARGRARAAEFTWDRAAAVLRSLLQERSVASCASR